MTELVENLIRHYGILAAALLIFLTELGIPTGVPNEVVLVLAGSYAVHSQLEYTIGLALVCAADILGTTSLYLLTRSGGIRLLNRLRPRRASSQTGRLRRWLGQHDVAVIIVARSLPLVRMSVAISAGLMRIQRKNYLLGVIPGALIWAGTPLTIGYLFRNDVHRLIDRDETLTQSILLVLPVTLLIIGLLWFMHRIREARQAEQLPESGFAAEERTRPLEQELTCSPPRET